MASINNIETLGKQLLSEATDIDVSPGAAAHVSPTGPDPKGFRFTARNKAGKVILQFEAETLDAMQADLRRRLNKKGQKP